MSVTENKLLEFLERSIDDPQTCNKAKKDIVIQEDVDLFIPDAILDHIEQEIIDYGTAHPEAPFWDFLKMLKPGDFADGEDDDDE